MTTPTPERATDAPTPEATDAAGSLLNKLDAEHITEVRAASWSIAVDILARALDAFAKAAVEKERARCLAHVADVVRNANGKSSGPTRVRIAAETISRRIAKGWAAS